MSFEFSNIAFWLSRQAELAPDRVALEVGEQTFTYRELDQRAASCAAALSALDIGPGDRVGAYLFNGNEYVEVFLACARLGAIVVPLSTQLAAPELEFIANDSGIRVLVYDAERVETVKTFGPSTGIQSALAVGESDDPSYEAAVEGAGEHGIADVGEDDVLAIFYTSGTTGRPKGAMLTHGNFFWTNLNIVLALDLERDERSLVVLPMFHVGGWNVNSLPVWWKGGDVILERSFDPGRVLTLIEERRITSFLGVPTIYHLLAEHPAFDQTDLSSLHFLVCGGAPLPVSLIRRYQERGVRFMQGYGLTEAAPNCLILAPEFAESKAGAAGRPYFFTDVRVVDADDTPVPPGGSGEVIVRGPSVMKGYWRQPEQTAAALRGGWLRTGDVGRLDEDGFIWIIDRVKDMFISGGENVYPAEVEKILAGHPDVTEAAVIGVHDERWGEVGRALVVLRTGAAPDPDELTRYCTENLAKFKVPKSFVFVDSLPRNPTGKLLKQEIRAHYGERS